MTNFRKVAHMNEAFGNKRGDSRDFLPMPDAPNSEVHFNGKAWNKVRKQSLNIFDELFELMFALGVPKHNIGIAKSVVKQAMVFVNAPDLPLVRDSITDIHVFAYGAHHLMGIDGDRDMTAVLNGVMTRFIKDDADKAATINKHAANGITDVYFEGAYPVMVMKSASDQSDAPTGKFLKSASYAEPVFYEVGHGWEAVQNLGLPKDYAVSVDQYGFVQGLGISIAPLEVSAKPERITGLSPVLGMPFEGKPVKQAVTWVGVDLSMNKEARELLDKHNTLVNREEPAE